MPSEGVTNATEEGKDPVLREGGPGNDPDPDPDHQNDARAEGTHNGGPSPNLNVGGDQGSNVSVEEPPSATRSRNGETLDRGPSAAGSNQHRRPTHVGEPLEQWEIDEMEALLGDLCGHLGGQIYRFTRYLLKDFFHSNISYPIFGGRRCVKQVGNSLSSFIRSSLIRFFSCSFLFNADRSELSS